MSALLGTGDITWLSNAACTCEVVCAVLGVPSVYCCPDRKLLVAATAGLFLVFVSRFCFCWGVSGSCEVALVHVWPCGVCTLVLVLLEHTSRSACQVGSAPCAICSMPEGCISLASAAGVVAGVLPRLHALAVAPMLPAFNAQL
jgi:hypothetical protein